MPIKGQKNAQKTQKSDSPVQQANEGAMLTADASEANQASVSSELVSHPDVMSAIKSMQTDFASRFDSLLNAIRGVQNEIQLIATRVSQTEDRIGNNEDDIATLKKDNCTLKGELEALTRKVDDLENRSRRSNLRLVGLPEKAEGRDMCSFLVKWIPEVLGTVSFPGPLIIERAHRIGRPPEADSAATGPAPRPRAVVMKFLNYADKTRVMRAAREMGTVLYEGKKIYALVLSIPQSSWLRTKEKDTFLTMLHRRTCSPSNSKKKAGIHKRGTLW
ncbi:hypothetical protein WMY93_001688 [Mugilogobius chulae]|uniref:L1 transposable element RRM domain-containing protein n=1 Tax=Mugilogobius chulae TaxID=88201 RepID=A0AAW0Q189_9GOBI